MKRTPYQMDQRVFKWMRPLFLAGSFARRSFLPELRGWGTGVLCECPLATMHELLGDTRIVSLCKGAPIVIGHVPGTGRSGDTRVEAGIVTGRWRFRNGTVGHVQQGTVLLGVPFVGFVTGEGHFNSKLSANKKGNFPLDVPGSFHPRREISQTEGRARTPELSGISRNSFLGVKS